MKIILKIVLAGFFLLTVSLTACNCGGDTGSTDPGDSSGSGDGGGIGFFDDESNDINELPDGIGIFGTLNGEEISIDEDQLETSITRMGYGEYFSFGLGVTNEDADNSSVITIYFSTYDEELFNSFEEGSVYELNVDELGVEIGGIEITANGTTETYDTDSMLLYFDEFGDSNGDDISGRMQVVNDNSGIELIVNFEGDLQFIDI